LIFLYFSDEEEILHEKRFALFDANVSASWHAKTVMRYHKWTDTFMGHIVERIFPEAVGTVLWWECLSHVLARFGTLPLALHTWTAAPSKRQAAAAPLAFRSAPSRFTPRLHYTISNKLEYCILRSRVFRSSGFSSARAQWNARI